MKTVGSPPLTDMFNVEQFVGHGSRAWIFRARNRHSDSQVALNLIPIKQDVDLALEWYVDLSLEWYASKRLRQYRVSGFVQVEEQDEDCAHEAFAKYERAGAGRQGDAQGKARAPTPEMACVRCQM